ncbi:uncharacterized protein LOC120205057 [Hibiscus syriacus]|uniref:uncharacterized protein LOC120205057 n=1 Tax=Hibiscus syriacus TaxID=106335 RepID=UPI0019219EE2|nr:uncharacterized protein LOC120205057 [Hibiscus syriacus]
MWNTRASFFYMIPWWVATSPPSQYRGKVELEASVLCLSLRQRIKDDILLLAWKKRRNSVQAVLHETEQKEANKNPFGNFIEVFPFGSVPLKTFLPDGDIDLTALTQSNMEENLAQHICSILQDNRQNPGFIVQNVQYIPAQVKIVKCTVNDIPVDISFNQMAGLSALCFLEKVNQLIGKDHLFKRSIILIKSWCYYESRILGAHHGLISTYALETMILHIINVFHSSLCGPLSVLHKFLDYYSTFDWANYCITITGPLPISSLPAGFAGTPETDGDEFLLSRDFLRYCRESYCASLQFPEVGDNAFPVKNMNIVDPLKVHNNLGRSVSKGNFHRIRCALIYGTQTFGEVLMLPGEKMGIGLENFFVNTLNRNGRGQRPDVQVPVHAFGTGKSEVSRLSGDFDVYCNGLLYSQWYHYYALNVPVMPATTVSSPSQTPKHGAWDALRWFVRCKRNTFYRKGTNFFIPRLQFAHPFALQLPAAYGIDNMTKSRGTGTYIPNMARQSYGEMQPCTSKRNHKPSNSPKENDPIENGRGNGSRHDLGLSTEQFPPLPSTKRTAAAGPSRPPALKSLVLKNGGSQCLSAIKFGCYEGPLPAGTHSSPPSLKDPKLCIPSVEKQKQKDLCERKRAPGEPFQLQDNEDFPPLLPM